MNNISIRSTSMAQPLTPQQPVSNDNTQHPPMITEGMRARFQSLNVNIDRSLNETREIAKPHIDKNKTMILEGAKGLTGTALILGMGRGPFIPLKELCEQFDKVVAIDIDKTGMESAVEKLPEALREKIILQEDDLTGFVGQFSTLIDKLSDECKDVDHFLNQITTAIPEFTCKPLSLSDYGASYVISSMVLCQLVCCPVEYLVSVVKNKYNQSRELVFTNNAFMRAVTQLTYKIQNAHTEQVDEAIIPGGRVYLSLSAAEIYLGFKGNNIVPVSKPMVMIDPKVLDKAGAQVQIVKKDEWNWDEKHPEKKIMFITQSPGGFPSYQTLYSRGSRYLVAAQIREKK